MTDLDKAQKEWDEAVAAFVLSLGNAVDNLNHAVAQNMQDVKDIMEAIRRA